MKGNATPAPAPREAGGNGKIAVSITYCRPCGYERRARDAAGELERALGHRVELVAGSGGIFEVKLNDQVVTKRVRGYFPSADDIVVAVQAALQSPAG